MIKVQKELEISNTKEKELNDNLENLKEKIKEKSELFQLELSQNQKELEESYIRINALDELHKFSQLQINRAGNILGKLSNNESFEVDIKSEFVNVEIFPPDEDKEYMGTVQMKALIDSYEKSLKRASYLFKKFINLN